MTFSEVIESVMGMARIRALARPVIKDKDGSVVDPGFSIDQLRESMGQYERSVVDEVALSYEWDFALSYTTTTGISGTADYPLPGSDDDALSIMSVYYDGSKLQKLTTAALDDKRSRNDVSTVSYWTPTYRDEGVQVVTITGTPGESGKTIKYWYWRNNVDVAEIPAILSYLLQMALAKRVLDEYVPEYEMAKARAVASYERGANGPDTTVLDSQITAQNNRRSGLHGWSG